MEIRQLIAKLHEEKADQMDAVQALIDIAVNFEARLNRIEETLVGIQDASIEITENLGFPYDTRRLLRKIEDDVAKRKADEDSKVK